MSPYYKITDKTMAILPYDSPKNTSKVFEADQEKNAYFQRDTLKNYRKELPEIFFFLYSRRAAVLYHEPHYKVKTPIPISQQKEL